MTAHGPPTPTPPDAPGARLSRGGRAWRLVVALGLAAGFLGGTTVGQDDWWPFSPWRMYSTSTSPNASVISTVIDVRDAEAPDTWRPAPITPWTVGVNRAEVEGRMPQIRRDPAMLATLAASHARLRPGEPEWIGIRVVVRNFILSDGALTGEVRDDIVAEWSAP